MTEAQSWVLIGVFATALFGMITIVSTMFMHAMRSEFRRIDTRIEALGERIDRLQSEMVLRFGVLDREVGDLVKHVFGIDRD